TENLDAHQKARRPDQFLRTEIWPDRLASYLLIMLNIRCARSSKLEVWACVDHSRSVDELCRGALWDDSTARWLLERAARWGSDTALRCAWRKRAHVWRCSTYWTAARLWMPLRKAMVLRGTGNWTQRMRAE